MGEINCGRYGGSLRSVYGGGDSCGDDRMAVVGDNDNACSN